MATGGPRWGRANPRMAFLGRYQIASLPRAATPASPAISCMLHPARRASQPVTRRAVAGGTQKSWREGARSAAEPPEPPCPCSGPYQMVSDKSRAQRNVLWPRVLAHHIRHGTRGPSRSILEGAAAHLNVNRVVGRAASVTLHSVEACRQPPGTNTPYFRLPPVPSVSVPALASELASFRLNDLQEKAIAWEGANHVKPSEHPRAMPA